MSVIKKPGAFASGFLFVGLGLRVCLQEHIVPGVIGDAEILGKVVLRSHEILDASTDRGDFDAPGNVGGKCVCHEVACLVEAEAAGNEIEDGVFIDGADGGTMGAFDVVGVDFEGGLGVHEGGVGEEERFAGLLGIGFLGIFLHEYFALEHAGGMAVEDMFVEFVTGAVGFFVVEESVVVDVLFTMGKD